MRSSRLGSIRFWRAVMAFARSAHGGATLAGGAIMLTVMITVGGMMTNFAWREAQLTELRGATRAAVAAAASLLRGGAEEIQERVAEVAEALVPGLDVDPADVTVPTTRERIRPPSSSPASTASPTFGAGTVPISRPCRSTWTFASRSNATKWRWR